MSNIHIEGFGEILTPSIGTGINGIPGPLSPSTIFWISHWLIEQWIVTEANTGPYNVGLTGAGVASHRVSEHIAQATAIDALNNVHTLL